jgi:hypothetical protein
MNPRTSNAREHAAIESAGLATINGLEARHSQVTVPFKGVLQRCDYNRKAMIVHSVEAALFTDAETAYEMCRGLIAQQGLIKIMWDSQCSNQTDPAN